MDSRLVSKQLSRRRLFPTEIACRPKSSPPDAYAAQVGPITPFPQIGTGCIPLSVGVDDSVAVPFRRQQDDGRASPTTHHVFISKQVNTETVRRREDDIFKIGNGTPLG